MKICLSLHFKTANSFLHANGVKIQHVTAKDSEIKPYPLCLGNTLKDSTVSNMKQKNNNNNNTGLNGKIYDFSFGYDTSNISDIEDIHRCLMKNRILCKCLDSLSTGFLF